MLEVAGCNSNTASYMSPLMPILKEALLLVTEQDQILRDLRHRSPLLWKVRSRGKCKPKIYIGYFSSAAPLQTEPLHEFKTYRVMMCYSNQFCSFYYRKLKQMKTSPLRNVVRGELINESHPN